ncbi:UDP-N-acetylmuramoyl-L-alanine--D-glutamate ligase [bacterium F11]|nr:UDP-N-acetylmuramoyl-L-alanine--D-glutamate ligase [bacterium F11]
MAVPHLKGKRVLVVGLGISGISAARFLCQKGSLVSIFDQKSKKILKPQLDKLPSNVSFLSKTNAFEANSFDLLVVSPGVPWDHPLLVKARKKGIPVWPELELGWRFVRPRKTVAITGTNGKTTTTRLIEAILKNGQKKVVVGGNIGHPLTSLISRIKSDTILVLEISSYQLEAHHTFHPNIAVWLNLTPDHLGRHRTMRRYANAKNRLFQFMKGNDVVVLNRKDKWCREAARTIRCRKKWFPTSQLKKTTSTLLIPGEHNVENAMASSVVAESLGVLKKDILKTLSTFSGVEHRLQKVAVKKGVTYINDSKSTNIDSTKVALKAFGKNVYLILGGEHKGTPYTSLIPYMKRKVRNVLTIGESSHLIKQDLKDTVRVVPCQSLKRAVWYASRQAKNGDIVLLSPACASFDQYKNFEERGHDFIRNVKKIVK